MSTGPRIPLARAEAVASTVMELWRMRAPACAVVGSVRRRKVDVGDIELIAPLPDCLCQELDPFKPEPPPATAETDPLFSMIRSTCGKAPDLFDPNPPPPVARAVEGLKPGFLAASLEVNIAGAVVGAGGEALPVNVQVFRYTPGDRGSRGWCELMRTGPQDFGIWFLMQWKERMQIRAGGRGSIEGWLVDPHGKRVPTPDEEACFRLIQRPFVPPEEREEFAARASRQWARERDEVMR